MPKLNEKQKDLLKRRNIVVFTTSNMQGKPRSIFVEVNHINDGEIIITDNEMGATKDNFLENDNVFILAFELDYSYCLKIEGEVKYYNDGKYFDFVKNLDTNKKRTPKGAVLVNIKKVIEFN